MIGTLRESSLHAALKQWYACPGDTFEVSLEGYFIDIQREGTLIEIQTRNFSAMRTKLRALIDRYPVRLIHPIAQEKYVVQLASSKSTPKGQLPKPTHRRKSPRKGQLTHLFSELVSLPDLVAHPNFSLTIVLTREEEIQTRGRGGSWRRKGWKIIDRKLLEVVETVVLNGPQDFLRFLPASLSEPFTTRELSRQGHYPIYLAQKMTYCLSRMGAIEAVGKQGRAVLYAVTSRGS